MDASSWRLYEMKAQIIQAVGHPIRLAILDLLAGGEQCVCDIAKAVDSERSNVSRHLAILLDSDILECRKEGLKVIYSLKTPCILQFLCCVSDVLRRKLQAGHEMLSRL